MNTIRQLSANRSDIIVASFHTDLPSTYSRFLFPNFNKYIQTTTNGSEQIMVKVRNHNEDSKTMHMGKEELEIIRVKSLTVFGPLDDTATLEI